MLGSKAAIFSILLAWIFISLFLSLFVGPLSILIMVIIVPIALKCGHKLTMVAILIHGFCTTLKPRSLQAILVLIPGVIRASDALSPNMANIGTNPIILITYYTLYYTLADYILLTYSYFRLKRFLRRVPATFPT